MDATNKAGLGKEQRTLLETLVEHGYWYHGAGWVWSTRSRTTKLLDSLKARRLVSLEREANMGSRGADVYRPTPAGVELVASWRQARQAAKLATSQQPATLEDRKS